MRRDTRRGRRIGRPAVTAVVLLVVSVVASACTGRVGPRAGRPATADAASCEELSSGAAATTTVPASVPPTLRGPDSQHIDPEEIDTFYEHLAEAEVEPREVIAGIRDVVRSFDRQTVVRLPSTGLVVDVRSDGPVAVHRGELDRLITMIAGVDGQPLSAQGEELLPCYDRWVVDGRQLEGTRLRILVPSDPSMCFGSLVLTRRDDAPGGECDSTGLSLPAIELGVTAFGMQIGRLSMPATIVLAPGVQPDASPARAAAVVLTHELVHFLDNQMGRLPAMDDLHAYERRAYRVEERLDRLDEEGAIDLPQPLTFPVGPPGR